jgi:hypothetical protein
MRKCDWFIAPVETELYEWLTHKCSILYLTYVPMISMFVTENLLFMKKISLLLFFIPLLAVCQPSAVKTVTKVIYPSNEWEKVDPASAGWDVDKLRALHRFVFDSSAATGMYVIQSGKVLFEYGDVKTLSYLASCRKSVLSMLYGPFVANGTINLNTTIAQLGLDDQKGLLPIEKKATIGHLLTARSGVYHPASNPGDATDQAPKRGTVKPGSFWLYNNWDFNIAGYILEYKTGRTIYQLIDSILARPLQMQDWDIAAQQKGGDTSRSRYLAYHMWFSTRDMARLGYLMLRNGQWNEMQIIPSKWVKTSTATVTTYREAVANKTAYYKFGYAYLWWVWDKQANPPVYQDAYTASGAFGQYITVIPKLDMVVAFKTKFENGRQTSTDTYLRILEKLVEAKVK